MEMIFFGRSLALEGEPEDTGLCFSMTRAECRVGAGAGADVGATEIRGCIGGGATEVI